MKAWKQSSKYLILSTLSILVVGGALAQVVIPTGLTNAVQYIMQTVRTDDGTDSGLVNVNIDDTNIYIRTGFLANGTGWNNKALGVDTSGNVVYVDANNLNTFLFPASNYIPKINSTQDGLEVSTMYQIGGLIGINTTTPVRSVDILGDFQVATPGNSYTYQYNFFQNSTTSNILNILQTQQCGCDTSNTTLDCSAPFSATPLDLLYCVDITSQDPNNSNQYFYTVYEKIGSGTPSPVLVTSGANVGIRTDNPQAALDVSGNVMIHTTPAGLTTWDVLTINPTTKEVSTRSAGSFAGTPGWSLVGNAGTNSSTNFLGTTDNQDLVIKTNNNESLRATKSGAIVSRIGGNLQPSSDIPVRAAGTRLMWIPQFTEYMSTNTGRALRIGNLEQNEADRWDPQNMGVRSTAIGQSVRAKGNYSIALGVRNNVNTAYSNILGGGFNSITGGVYSTIAGGASNSVNGVQSVIGGGGANTINGNTHTIAGGTNNSVTGARSNTIGGGEYNSINSSLGDSSTIAGGKSNSIIASYATIAGGWGNIASGISSFIGGGYQNTASGSNSTVAGGEDNRASGVFATIGGGANNRATNQRATVAGGGANTGGSIGSTVAGGYNNSAMGSYSTVAGGSSNQAQGTHSFAAGQNAIASGANSFVWNDGSQTYPIGATWQNGSNFNNEFMVNANRVIIGDIENANTIYRGLGYFGFNTLDTYLPGVVGIDDIRAADANIVNLVVGNSFTPPSDEKLKTNIQYATSRGVSGIDILELLNPVTFQWDTTTYPDAGFNNTMRYGFIAQDVQSVLPNIVSEIDSQFLNNPGETEGQTYYGMDPLQIIPILVEAVKEQQVMIEQLQADVAALTP